MVSLVLYMGSFRNTKIAVSDFVGRAFELAEIFERFVTMLGSVCVRGYTWYTI